MSTIYLYRVYCIQENKDVFQWSEIPPTICPNDHGDRTIDSSRTVIVDSRGKEIVTVNEPTDGYYQAITDKIIVPSDTPGSTYIHNLSFPMDVIMWRSEFKPSTNMVGDELSVIAGPDTIVGTLTSSGSIGETTITVSSTVITNVVKGIDIAIDDTVNYQDLGRVTAIDTDNSTITFENSLTNNYAIGSLIKINICMLRDYVIDDDSERLKFGDKGFKGKLIPAGTVMRLKYKNNNGQAKTWYWRLEYYYE